MLSKMSEPSNTQTNRILSLQETMKPQTPFIGNKNIRVASGALLGILFIFILGSMLTSAVVMWKLFWDGKNPGSSYSILMESNPDHKEWKRALESSLGLCGAVILVIVILLVLYFLFLETDFMFSERLSRNLSIATQGPDRLRKVAGLLTNYVYPPGSVPDTVRASLANQFIMRLRQAYDTQNQITRLAPEDYDNLETIRGTSAGQVGFTPGTQNLTSQEYQLINQLATQRATEAAREAGRPVAPEDIQGSFNDIMGKARNVMAAAHSDDMLAKVGAPTQAQRMNYIYGAAGMDTPEVAREKAAQEAERTKQMAENAQFLKEAEAAKKAYEYSETQLKEASEARNKTVSDLAKKTLDVDPANKDQKWYQKAVGEHAVLTAQAKEAQENWEKANALHTKNTEALEPYQIGAKTMPHPDVST